MAFLLDHAREDSRYVHDAQCLQIVSVQCGKSGYEGECECKGKVGFLFWLVDMMNE